MGTLQSVARAATVMQLIVDLTLRFSPRTTSTTPSTRGPVRGARWASCAGLRVAWTLLQKRTWFPQLALRWRRETKTLQAKPR